MNKEQYQRLLPFMYRKGARQRVILYLIADGHTVRALTQMRVREFKTTAVRPEIMAYCDEAVDGLQASATVFRYPGGMHVPGGAYQRLVHQTTFKILGLTLSTSAFRNYISTGNKGRK